MQKPIWYIIIIISCALYGFALYQDAYLAKVSGPGDLRNRIVGARLLKDGINPYTYKYRIGDSIQYFDAQNCTTESISNVTASPFLLKLLKPICIKPQAWLNKALYLCLQFAFCTLLIIVLLKQRKLAHRAITLLLLISTMYWDAWIMHVYNTQTYFLFGFIFFTIYLLLESYTNNYKTIKQILAGVLIALMVLIKLNFCFLFIPFILHYQKIWKSITSASLCVIIYISIVFTHSYSKQTWQQYFGFLKIYAGQAEGNWTHANNDPCPEYINIEGINISKLLSELKTKPVNFNIETANFFNIYWFVTNKSIDRKILAVIMFTLVFTVLAIAFYKNKKHSLQFYQIALLGICMYLIADFYGPIFRHPYYATQWIIGIAIMLINFNKIPKVSWVFLTLATLFYVCPFVFCKIQLTLAEQFLLIAMLYMCFRPNAEKTIMFQ